MGIKEIKKNQTFICVWFTAQIIIALICAAITVVTAILGDMNYTAFAVFAIVMAGTPAIAKSVTTLIEIDCEEIYEDVRKEHYLEDIRSYLETSGESADPEKIYEYLVYHEDANLSLWENIESAINYLKE